MEVGTEVNTKSALHHVSKFTSRQRTIALIVVAAGFVMDLLDATVVNTAIPSIQANLGISYAGIQWVLAGYMMAFALLLITGGRMGDVFGYKKIFLLGVGGFAVASLFSGIAWSPLVLIISRIAQGAMAALMVPQGTSTVQIMYKASERGQVMGLFGALGGLASAIGPVLAGVLIKWNIFGLDWRPIFLINLPVAALAIYFGIKYLPEGKSSHPLRLDWLGTVLAILAMSLLVFPLIQGRELGWSAWIFVMLALSIPAMFVFIRAQLKKTKQGDSPLVVTSLFNKKSFSLGLIVNSMFAALMMGVFLTFTLYLQIGLGWSPLHAALTGLPISFGVAFVMMVFGKKLPHLGRNAVILGSITSGVGYFLILAVLHHFRLATNSLELIPGMLLFGVGMGIVFALLFTIILNDVDQKHAGSASGVLEASQQVGSAIGIALIGVIFFGVLAHSAASSFSSAVPQLKKDLTSQRVSEPLQQAIIAGTKQCFTDIAAQKDSSKIPASCESQNASAIPASTAKSIDSSIKHANANNFDKAFIWGAALGFAYLVVIIVLSIWLPKKLNPNALAH